MKEMSKEMSKDIAVFFLWNMLGECQASGGPEDAINSHEAVMESYTLAVRAAVKALGDKAEDGAKRLMKG